MIFLQLFWEFFKIGLFAVGGGLSTIPFLYDLADAYPWFTQAELTDMIAVSEATPGPIGINMATFSGYTAGFSQYGAWGGILGGVLASLAIVLPSLVIIVIIARLLSRFDQNPMVRAAFAGLRPAVAALIGAAAWQVMQVSLVDLNAFSASGDILSLFLPVPLAIFALTLFFILKFKKINPTWYLLAGAALGVAFGL